MFCFGALAPHAVLNRMVPGRRGQARSAWSQAHPREENEDGSLPRAVCLQEGFQPQRRGRKHLPFKVPAMRPVRVRTRGGCFQEGGSRGTSHTLSSFLGRSNFYGEKTIKPCPLATLALCPEVAIPAILQGCVTASPPLLLREAGSPRSKEGAALGEDLVQTRPPSHQASWVPHFPPGSLLPPPWPGLTHTHPPSHPCPASCSSVSHAHLLLVTPHLSYPASGCSTWLPGCGPHL